MENLLLLPGMALLLVFGHWLMKRLDAFLKSGRFADDDATENKKKS